MMGRHLDRRTLLQLIGGVAVAGVPRMSGAAVESVVIAGGGIIGANLAYRFAKRGASVTVVERTKPASGATANSFAWINSTYSKQPLSYFNLNRLEIEADVLIVACGTDTPRVAALAGVRVPLKESPGVLVHTPPQPRVLERVVLSPVVHMKQKPDGRIVCGSGFGGSPTNDASREAAEQFLSKASQVLPAFARTSIEKVTLGYRPLPPDEFPIIGFSPARRAGYVTVMHSRVTLAPLVA